MVISVLLYQYGLAFEADAEGLCYRSLDLVGEGEAELSRVEFLLVALDIEDATALEDEEDLVAEVVAVHAGDLARLHTQEARADVGSDEEVFYVLLVAEVEDLEGHGVVLLALVGL